MRASLGSNETKEKQEEFMNYLLRIGNGLEPTVKCSMDEESIKIKNIMVSKSTNLDNFIDEVYPNISNVKIDSSYALERTILTPKNEDVDSINVKVLNKMNGKEFVYYSADDVVIKSDKSQSNET